MNLRNYVNKQSVKVSYINENNETEIESQENI